MVEGSPVTKVKLQEKNDTHIWVPFANEISIETLVNLLVEKGICSSNEIFTLEGRIRDNQVYNNKESLYLNIHNPYDRGRFPGFKKAMSKYRWSRQLGTLIFGWKWKRVKKS